MVIYESYSAEVEHNGFGSQCTVANVVLRGIMYQSLETLRKSNEHSRNL